MSTLIEHSVFLIDKPYRWTSYNIVKKIQVLLRQKYGVRDIKVGHAGTLDPLATGLLIVCVGKATKGIDLIQAGVKEYIAEIQFGATTPSFDLETKIDQEYPHHHLTKESIKEELLQFVGIQDQTPPVYSAVQINGKRAYKTAHKGGSLEMPVRTIEIMETELMEYKSPVAKIRIVCSKGTYIRAFARDLGKRLDSGAHLIGLIRTRIGDYSLNNAYSITDFEIYLNSL